MEPRQLQLRVMILRGVFLVALAVLTARLWSLQIARWSAFNRAAQENRTDVVWTPAPRGAICDRTGKVLADSQVVYQVQITRKELPTDPQDMNAAVVILATVLGASTVDVEKALAKAQEAKIPDAVLPKLGENITQLQAIRLDEHRSEMPGIRVVDATQRHYPGGRLAAHAVGYARAISADEYEAVKGLTWPDPPGGSDTPLRSRNDKQKVYAEDSVVGKTGVERLCDRVLVGGRVVPALQGRRGADEFEVDVGGTSRLIARVPPIRGATVYLTLDARLQQVAERALAHPFPEGEGHPPEGAAAVVLDVRTGEVLVMASYPAIDENLYIRGFGNPEEYQRLLAGLHSPELNRAVAGLYPPGSVFKMISGCAVLEATPVNLGTTFLCTGHITVGSRHERFTCWNPSGHGYMQFERAVAESCDVYFWEAVRQAGLSSDDIGAYARKFGLGELTGSGLPNEQEGLIPTAEWKRQAKDERWLQGDTLNEVIGQGYLKVTPAQMARAAAAAANGGRVLPLRLVRKIVWPDEAGIPPVEWASGQERSADVKPATLKAICAGMRLAVADRHGTGRGPMAGLAVSAAAKTGSAESLPGRPPHSWFCCFAPYENPQIAVAVIIEYGGHGAEAAGNVARQILQAAFASPPQGVADVRPQRGPHV